MDTFLNRRDFIKKLGISIAVLLGVSCGAVTSTDQSEQVQRRRSYLRRIQRTLPNDFAECTPE